MPLFSLPPLRHQRPCGPSRRSSGGSSDHFWNLRRKAFNQLISQLTRLRCFFNHWNPYLISLSISGWIFHRNACISPNSDGGSVWHNVSEECFAKNIHNPSVELPLQRTFTIHALNFRYKKTLQSIRWTSVHFPFKLKPLYYHKCVDELSRPKDNIFKMLWNGIGLGTAWLRYVILHYLILFHSDIYFTSLLNLFHFFNTPTNKYIEITLMEWSSYENMKV